MLVLLLTFQIVANAFPVFSITSLLSDLESRDIYVNRPVYKLQQHIEEDSRLILVVVNKLHHKDVQWTNKWASFDKILYEAYEFPLDHYIVTYWYDCEFLEKHPNTAPIEFKKTCAN